MEKILPIAGATGAHAYAPHEADPPSLIIDEDQNSDRAMSPTLAPNSDEMDVDANQSTALIMSAIPASNMSSISSSTGNPSTSALSQPPTTGTKRQRLGDDDGDGDARSGSSPALSVPNEQKRISGKGKAKASSGRSSDAKSFKLPSTSQRVNKITPAAALVELHGSVSGMTQAIIDASKLPESTEDKAVARFQQAVRLVQQRDDGLSISEKASLIVYFGNHTMDADIYINLTDDQIWREVVKKWIM